LFFERIRKIILLYQKADFSENCNLGDLFLKDNILILSHLIHFFPFYFNNSFFFHIFAWKCQKLKNNINIIEFDRKNRDLFDDSAKVET